MANGYSSDLIAALRGGAEYGGPIAGTGPEELNFNWGNGAALNLRRRALAGALNPQRLTLPKGAGFAANQSVDGDSSYRDGSSGLLPLPTTITPPSQKEQVDAPEPVLYEPDLSNMELPLPPINLEPEPTRDVSISYEELVDANPWNVPAPPAELVQKKPEPEVAITYEELVDPDPWNRTPLPVAPPAEVVQQKPEPEVAITYEELVDPNPWNVQAPPADAVKTEPEVEISYEELVDPNPWNVQAPPADAVKEEPEVSVSVEEIPDVEPSTLREMIAALLPPVMPPAPEPEPEGTVTVEEIPDEPPVAPEPPAPSAPAPVLPAPLPPPPPPEPEATVTVEEIPEVPEPVVQEVAPEPLVQPALREIIEALMPPAPPPPEPEPEGTVTVEEVPDEPLYVNSGRTGGGDYGINTGLSREMMMLAMLADMLEEPQGQITIEELDDFR